MCLPIVRLLSPCIFLCLANMLLICTSSAISVCIWVLPSTFYLHKLNKIVYFQLCRSGLIVLVLLEHFYSEVSSWPKQTGSCGWEWLLNTKSSSWYAVAMSLSPASCPSLLSAPLAPHFCQCGTTISQYQLEMWWMTGGGRESRPPQSLSGLLPLPISLPFSPALGQPPSSHTHLNFLVSDESLTFLLQDKLRGFFYRRERGHHG